MEESISLRYKQGTSDKVYNISLLKKDSGWVVHFNYGRFGNTLNTGTKTEKPVDYKTAKKIYDKLVTSKTQKGYTPGENGTTYTHTSLEERDTGIRVQLLNSVEEEELGKYLGGD